ncbi:MAG: hypothetical protein WAV76_06850 [Bacteroidota bacterium]
MTHAQFCYLYGMLFLESVVSVIGIFRFRKVDAPIRWLIVSMVYCTLSSIAEAILALHGIQNLWLEHISDVIDMSFFLIIFYKWQTGRYNARFIRVAYILFFIVWVIDGIFFDAFHKGANFAATLEGVLEITFTVNLLANGLLDERNRIWKNDPRFWVASGYLLSAAGTFLLYSLFRTIVQLPLETFRVLWQINWFFSCVAFLFFARALFCKPEKIG